MGNSDRFELESLKLACNRLLAEREVGGSAYENFMDLDKIAWARRLIDRIVADIEDARETDLAA
jgi:hypothetical protein